MSLQSKQIGSGYMRSAPVKGLVGYMQTTVRTGRRLRRVVYRGNRFCRAVAVAQALHRRGQPWML